MPRSIEIKIGADTREFDRKIGDTERKFKSAVDGETGSLNSFRSAISASTIAITALGVAGVAAFTQIGRMALDAAIKIDRQVSALRALTGSAEAATKRFQELFKIAQATPGLTTSLAATLDAQLRVFNVAEGTINRLLPVVGRLNAISPLGDPRQFVNNLTQLISQNFERQDLKELVGQSPIAGKLLAQIFNVDNPTNAEAIRAAAKKMGVTTVERLADELVKAAENNPALKNAVETIGGQFDKLRDRLDVALAPLGKEIAKTLIPIFDDLVKAAEKYGQVAADVFKENRNDIIAAAKEITAMAVAIGQLVGKLGELALKSSVFEFIGRAAAETQDILNDPSNLFTTAKGPRLLEFERQLAERQTEAATIRNSPFLSSVERSLSSGGAITPPPSSSGGGGRTSAASSAAREAARKRAHEIKDMQEKIRDAIDEFGKGIVEDMEQIERAITEANLENIRRQPRDQQLARFGAATAERIRQIELETLRLEQNTRRQAAETLQRTGRREFGRSDAFIQDALNRGQITGGEAELLRQGAAGRLASQLREALPNIDPNKLDDLRDEIALMDRLSVSISNSERFMRGFNSQIESVGDAFDRFGANVSRAFTNVRDLFNGLKQAVLGFFNDLLGNALQNIVRSTLAPIFGSLGGLGGGTFGGSVFQAAGAGGISAPPSISQSGFGGILGKIFGGGGGGAASSTATGQAVSSGGFSLGGLAGGLAAAAPLLGLGLGSGLGGTSGLGQVLGAIGGGAVGLGISFGASVFGAGGGLASASLAALGPIALIGAPLIVGAILLGKAKQRKKDEEASGQMLAQALAAIDQLASGISSGAIDGSQARAIFENQILNQFIQQIRTLKTRSVVESRLQNQVQDLRNVFEARIPPLIAEQQRKAADVARFAAIDRRLIPEFATGGVVPGRDPGFDSVRALLRPGEMVLTRAQQASIQAQAGPGVFERAGVPTINQTGRFATGGIAPSGGSNNEPIVIEELMIAIDAESIAVRGMSGPKGRAVTVKNVKIAQLNREL